MSNTDFDQERAIASSLKRMGLLAEGEDFTARVLPGGVSCDVWRVTISGRDRIVKRALPKLRVSADWYAPAERSAAEVAWFKLVETIDARLAPKVLGEDRARHLFAMAFLPPETYPLWKAQLSRGIVEPHFAAKVGAALARIHAATADRADIAKVFVNGAQFHALRLEPYLLYTA